MVAQCLRTPQGEAATSVSAAVAEDVDVLPNGLT